MKAKSFFVPALGASALLSVLLAPMPSKGQAGADDVAVGALVAEVAAQQASIAENQAKIDAKLAIIAENIRLARIFASRAK